jgi:hypothetical protein
MGRMGPMRPINSVEAAMNDFPDSAGFIPPHGNHGQLFSYQKAEVIYDLTYRFCQRFLTKGDRTIDQMVQAARSGKQNIVEGCQAAGASKEMEIKLTSVARPAWRNCWPITTISCACATYGSGPKTPRRPAACAGEATGPA